MDAIILSGGLGTRLRSVVSDRPKCMAPVAGKPFIHYLLEWLKDKDVNKVILSVGYLREHVISWIDTHRNDYPFTFDFAVEETPLGTGGGIKFALSKTTSDKILVLNGDTFFDIDPASLVSPGAVVSLALKPMKDFYRYGSVTVNGTGEISSFNEKVFCPSGLINGGVYIIDKNLIDFDEYPDVFSFEKDILVPLAGKGLIKGTVCNGYFIDIGIPSDYAKAELHWGDYDTLLLDRDGLINKYRPDDYVKDWNEFEFIPEFLQTVPEWSEKFKHIFVVTNQRGVGRGIMSEEQLEIIHRKMVEEIEKAGGRIDRLFVCTATSNTDFRRKPNPGMFEDILKSYPDVRRSKSVMVGDKDSDIAFAKNAGIKGIKINWE